jgi:hypothetical protein
MIQVCEILPKVFHLKFETQEALMRHFVRFQEHYESANPMFRKKAFTLEEFQSWYSSFYGAWTYYEDWSGCNVPGFIFEKFREGIFNPLREEEETILSLLPPKADFYVIGTCTDKDDALDHEIAHAFFYTNQEYRLGMTQLVQHYYSELADLFTHLKKIGYGDNVIVDEAQAYLSTEEGYLKEEGVKVSNSIISHFQHFYSSSRSTSLLK